MPNTKSAAKAMRQAARRKVYNIKTKDKFKSAVKTVRKEITKGVSVGSKIAVGKAHIILSPKQIGEFKPGEVLVTDITDPDWEPIMKIASAIVTDKGGRTSHAAMAME
jgi:pyruvate,water dikinase